MYSTRNNSCLVIIYFVLFKFWAHWNSFLSFSKNNSCYSFTFRLFYAPSLRIFLYSWRYLVSFASLEVSSDFVCCRTSQPLLTGVFDLCSVLRFLAVLFGFYIIVGVCCYFRWQCLIPCICVRFVQIIAICSPSRFYR